MNFYHETELKKLVNCPPLNYIPKECECYRWVFYNLNDDKNFKSQAEKNPRVLNDKNDREKCDFYALSFHGTLEGSKRHYEGLKKKFKNISKNLGTHIAKGYLNQIDGVGSNMDAVSHFNFHNVKTIDFYSKFEIVEVL